LYGAPAAMFQPRAQRRRDHGPGRRAPQLKPRLVLALPSGTFTGEQRAHHGATRPLNEREAVARAGAEQEGQRAQDEVTEKDLHGESMM
jgi:hypothetical protein